MNEEINYNPKLTKIEQVAESIIAAIESGQIKPGEKLMAIKTYSKTHGLSKDTVENAYKLLKRRKYIVAVKGRGNYVLGVEEQQIRVLLLFNKMSSYKKLIHDALLSEFGAQAKVDLVIHNYNPKTLVDAITEHLHKYHFYVIMPHFFYYAKPEEYMKAIQLIPDHQLVLMDKDLPQLKKKCLRIFQDFKEDIYEALVSVNDLILGKYKQIIVIFPADCHHPVEVNMGVMTYCTERGLKYALIDAIEQESLVEDTIYIALTEVDLGELLKKIKESNLTLGKHVGVISFNDSLLKELLDITVITTDFSAMGRTAAKLMLNNKLESQRNQFGIITRGSL